MDVYVGAKIIKAEEMTKAQFAKRQNRPYEPAENYIKGYRVLYPQPNSLDFYEAWSPKEVFELCYRMLFIEERQIVSDAVD